MKRLISLYVLLLLSFALLAQNVKIKGTIISADEKTPLAGASVVVIGTTDGTMTDVDGKFSIDVPQGAKLEVSFIGFESQIIKIGDTARSYILELLPDQTVLDDVVVIGYGSVKKSESTVASSGIRASDMKMEGTASFEQSLQGKLAGVVVINTEGAPGAAMSIEVRGVASISGSSEPLYVIDGIPVNSESGMSAGYFGHDATNSINVLSTLNPHDIESIEVLKDASATAIYGSRGSNGVVLITTKSGRTGRAKVNFSYNHGISNITKKIDVLTPREFAEYRNWATGWDVYFDDSSKPEYKRMPAAGLSSTKWQDLIYQTGRTNEYALSVSGGSKDVTYMISANYFDQKGIIVSSGFERYSLRSNLTFNLAPKIKLISNTNITRGSYDSVTTSVKAGDINMRGVVAQALIFDPAVPVNYQPGNDEQDDNDAMTARRNPYLETTEPTRLSVNDRLITNLTLNAGIIRNLKLTIKGGIDYNISRSDTYFPETTQQGKPSATGLDKALAGIASSANMRWINEDQLTYSNVFADAHSVTATAVFSIEENISSSIRNSIRGFANDDLLNNVLQNGLMETATINTGKVRTSIMSYTARVNYGYKSRYMLTATIRADGSSKFGKNNKFGYFPSVAVAWNAAKEPAFKKAFNASRISSLKFRVSWGVVGNQAIPSYLSQNSLSFGRYPLDDNMASVVKPTRLANPDLRWESTEQANVGIDLGFFKENLLFTFNAYYKQTTGLLQKIIIPGSTGFTSQYQNSGDIENKGIELEIDAKPFNKKDFQWRIMGNISFNRNKILSLGDDVTEQFTSNLGNGSTMSYTPFIQKVGLPLGALWGFKTNGIYQTEEDYAGLTGTSVHYLEPGEVNIVNVDGDDKITDNDRCLIGDVNPKFTFGLTNQLTYKRFDLSILITGKVGGDIYNQLLQSLEFMQGYGNMTRYAWDNRWQGPYSSNLYPKINKINQARIHYASDRFVEDGTYVRIKNIRLGFRFDNKLFHLPKFPSGQIFLSVDNLYTFTKYRGYDPEVSSYGQNAAFRGVDVGAYPQCRTFSFGINLDI